MKILFITLGTIALLLGIIGLFLPVLPTTPFLLLASACYMRGSERMHHWLLNNRVFGRYIRDYEERRAIPLRAKIMALVLMWAGLLVSALLVEAIALKVLLAATGAGVTVYLIRLKTLR